MLERVPTGITGLDTLLEGGIPRERLFLLAGACGSGKSIFGMQFIYKGATEYKEPGVFVTFDEPPERIREDMSTFGWNIHDLEKNDLIAIVDASSARAGAPSTEEHALMPGELDFDKVIIDILGVARRIGAKRLVIDSVPAMGLQVDEHQIRRNILKLSYVLAKAGITSILTTEIPEQLDRVTQLSKYGIEEFVVDGVFVLGFIPSGDKPLRTLHVRKMRATKHDMGIHPMEITNKGMVVKKREDAFK